MIFKKKNCCTKSTFLGMHLTPDPLVSSMKHIPVALSTKYQSAFLLLGPHAIIMTVNKATSSMIVFPNGIQAKAVIFDFDGVIVDTEPLHYAAFQRALEPLG